MFVKLWIIFLKGRKQKNMIWNHLEKKQGGKTYSDTSLLFWQPWWVPVLWRSFHLGNVVIFIDERTLPSSAIQACRMLAGLLISKDAQWWRVCLQRRSQPSWFLPNSEWRNIPKKRCVGNKYGFQYIYIRYHMIVLIYGIDIYSLCVTCESKTSVSVSMNIMFVS